MLLKNWIIMVGLLSFATFSFSAAFAYPPAVGILGKAKNCLVCHSDNGGWKNGSELVIDILNNETQNSLRQPDGSFLLTAKRGEPITLLTVIGYKTEDENLIPHRNAWLYIDPKQIGTTSLSKFLSGWDVNLPMACRVVGDRLELYAGTQLTALPMTILPSDSAVDGDVTLQVMLTKGESVKGKPKEGIVGNYFERKLHLKVVE